MTNQKEDIKLPDFEGALHKLDAIVSKMESGELTLEQALKEFESGVALARQCQQALQQAEQRITQLLSESDPHEH